MPRRKLYNDVASEDPYSPTQEKRKSTMEASVCQKSLGMSFVALTVTACYDTKLL